MAEDSVTLFDQLVRAERNGHVDSPELPFHPCAPVKPDRGVVKPFIAFFLELFYGLKGGFRTDPVRSMRVSKVSGHVDLIRLEFEDQFLDDIKILLGTGKFGDSVVFLERKVEDMDVLINIKS